MLALLARCAFADPVDASVHGDVKSFFVASGSVPWFGLSDDALGVLDVPEDEALESFGLASGATAQGIASARLKLALSGSVLRFDLHWAVAAQNATSSALVPGSESGVALTAPELVRLTWRPDLGGGLALQHRFDRVVLSAKLPNVDLSVGRQPISFGSGNVFTPLDLVNPFHPATIDSEYKPGVDALRVDGFLGTSGKLTMAAAYAGERPLAGPDRRTDGPILDDLVLAAAGQGTVGVTDLGLFLGLVHADPVVGVTLVSAAGPVGLHGDATLTIPGDAADPFVRAVAGADWRPTTTTTLMGEAYVQTFGPTSPDRYLGALDDPRFLRGELWQMGQLYGSISLAQEITPIVAGNLTVIANLRDPSALIAAGASWSVADNAVVGVGAYVGAGARPDVLDFGLTVEPETSSPVLVPPTDEALAASVNSEFGLYPVVGYLQVRTYF